MACTCEEHRGSTDNSVTEKAWDGSAARFSDDQYQMACAACDPGDGTVKQRCFLPHHEPDGTINRAGVHASAQRFAALKGHDAGAMNKAKAHLRSHYSDLGEDPPDVLRSAPNKERAELLKGREVRRAPVVALECRDDSDGLMRVAGYASVTEVPYDMGFYTETVKRGAFTKTLSETPDVQLLVNHEGLPLARTTNQSLALTEDEKGLRFEARLDPGDPDAQQLTRKIRAGLMDQASFAFRVTRQTWDDDYENRSIDEVSLDRGDVSVCNYGASPSTSVAMRSLVADLGDDVKAELRRILTGKDDDDEDDLEVEVRPVHNLELYQARATALRLRQISVAPTP